MKSKLCNFCYMCMYSLGHQVVQRVSFVKFVLRIPQTAGLICSCLTKQGGNFQKILNKPFSQPDSPENIAVTKLLSRVTSTILQQILHVSSFLNLAVSTSQMQGYGGLLPVSQRRLHRLEPRRVRGLGGVQDGRV